MNAADYYTSRGRFLHHIREVVQTGTNPTTNAPIYRSFALCGGMQSRSVYGWVPADTEAELAASIDAVERQAWPCEKCLDRARKRTTNA